MIQRRIRTVHGPKTWERVREAYTAGMTAGEIERVYGVKPGALRQRAFREGWSRTALARAKDEALALSPPPVPPQPAVPAEAVRTALAHAAGHLAVGRPAETTALLKATDALHALALQVEAADARRQASEAQVEEEFAAWIEFRASALAEAVLSGESENLRPAHAAWARRWWAEHGDEMEEPR